LAAIFSAPVRPIYSDDGRIVAGERDLSGVPDLPATEPEPAAAAKTKKPKESLARRIFAALVPLIREDREYMLSLDRRLAALEAGGTQMRIRPGQILYSGTWRADGEYEAGDYISHGGGMWVALAASNGARPGKDPAAWRLVVKRGDAPT
jgi:hypothetical protein